MMIFFLFFHILAAVIWVGGMFFAYVMLRPSTAALDPPLRLALWERVFGRFFPWVWGCVVVLLLSGFGMNGLGVSGLFVDVMMGLGILMMLIFAHLYFSSWKRFRRALAAGSPADAGQQLDQIRKIVFLNLILGLIVVVVGATGPYWS